MIICHCNTVDHAVIEATINENLETIRRASCLLEAVGLVWRTSVDKVQDHINPLSCTSCFNRIGNTLQTNHHLFNDETRPSRNRQDCANCPRLGQCQLVF